MINVLIGYGDPGRFTSERGLCETIIPVSRQINSVSIPDPFMNEYRSDITTITVSYAALACGCPQWFESNDSNMKAPENAERFYLEPLNKELINANNLWDGEHLPLIVRLKGKFSEEKELPVTYHAKGELTKARIFWYDNIVIVSQANR